MSSNSFNFFLKVDRLIPRIFAACDWFLLVKAMTASISGSSTSLMTNLYNHSGSFPLSVLKYSFNATSVDSLSVRCINFPLEEFLVDLISLERFDFDCNSSFTKKTPLQQVNACLML